MRELHCWADEASQYDFGSDEWLDSWFKNGTCMLPSGHDGPHKFTPDDEIIITFADATAP